MLVQAIVWNFKVKMKKKVIYSYLLILYHNHPPPPPDISVTEHEEGWQWYKQLSLVAVM